MCLTFLKNTSSRLLLSLLTLFSVGVLGMAYVLEHYYGFQPCQMCLYEQKIFMVTGAISLFSLLLLSARWQHYAIVLLGFLFLGGALVAAYHVAIQHHWVSLPAFCSSQDFSSFDSVEALKEQMLKTPLVRCDQVTWSLFGLSLAAYNAIISLILALLCWKWACKHR
ncbi:MAG: disulfide bond formation protein B [Proteobacteria bacterium]|nr:disulfide bond formation protein B [Pseudomonadota bacterium]